MLPIPQTGVVAAEHLNLGATPDWDSIRLLLELARSGSFRRAAERLGLPVNAIRRRVEGLERQMQSHLVTRHVDGIRLTAEGDHVVAIAEEMETLSFGLAWSKGKVHSALEGVVRVGVTDGLGAFWVAPRLVEFQRALPRILVDLQCAMESADVLRLEADLSIQLTEPTSPDLKRIKLGRMHTMPFASKGYIDRFGIPADIAELVARHKVVLQVAEQTRAEEGFSALFPDVQKVGMVALQTNVASALVWAVVNGAGLGMVPTYLSVMDCPLVPVDVGNIRFAFDIWLTFHPEVGEIPRVRRLISFLVEAFDPKHNPWFRDDFIHPRDLMAPPDAPSPIIPIFGVAQAPTSPGGACGQEGGRTGGRDTGR